MEANQPPRSGASMNVQVLVATAARLVLNTALRMPYPYLPVFSRGLGVPVPRLIELLSIRSALAVGAPLLAQLPDRFGRRRMMCLALAVFSGAMAFIALWPGLIALAVGSVLGLAAKILFDTSVQSYIGERVPYAHRGRVMAFLELSWSGAFFLGLPVVGWLLVNAASPADAWRAPFGPLAVLGLLAAVVLWLVMPTGFWGQAVAFVLFRFFDAAKPGPVGWADRRFKLAPGQTIGWRQGFGILFDDLVAALCTLLVIALWRRWVG